jgi:hypothetical protein
MDMFESGKVVRMVDSVEGDKVIGLRGMMLRVFPDLGVKVGFWDDKTRAYFDIAYPDPEHESDFKQLSRDFHLVMNS